MKRYLESEPVCCLWRILLAAVFLFFTLGMARGAALVQDFYLPMPEAQIYQANSSIISGTGSTIASTFSIVVTGEGTMITYDHWEDGYETDLNHPTQASTQVWGDGNDANGTPPGFAHDPVGLVTGTVITLTNNVTLPRNPSTLLWDARDHLAATKALVVSRAGWPVNPGPVFAGAVGVLSTLDYGTNYISPVGQDMTNGLMRYVGMFVMAAQNNTTVTIDTNGTGAGAFSVVLNQGESYLINGGVKKGGRILANKPVQADLVIGHVGASYASDWFTLYPVELWDDTYYTPVSTSASGYPAYVYLFNPNTNAITINYSTQSGSGSFLVPGTNGVFQFQMPVGSGASFSSVGGKNFFALCTVAAKPSDDTAFNWGFTLVPTSALTTEADVGWGPGSADGTVNGSPVWVTALAATRLYVDYKGDHLGPLTNSLGDHYDTNFDLTTLQSQKIYDPSKNQTGMRVYTLDGTLITAAWGEDPDVASPGNPYIDAGTTVLPFPVPVLYKSAVIVTDAPPTGLSVGDTIAYTVQIDNKGLLPLGNTVVIDLPTTNLLYLTNTATWNGTAIPDSTSGTPFPLDTPGFTIPIILSRGTSIFTYLSRVTASGAVSNSVNIGGTSIFSQAYLPPAGSPTVSLNFTDTNGVSVGLYPAGANVYVTMTNAIGNTSPTTRETITVTVQDVTHGDVQNIVLTETSTNTGVFRNIAGLPTSTTTGLLAQDGTLNVTPGDTLSVAYTDPVYGDSASSTALIQIPALSKQLYLSANGAGAGAQFLTRVDPVAFNHSPTRTSVDMSAPAPPQLDSATMSSNTASLTVTFGHITSSASNRLMLVGISINRLDNTSQETPTNVTYANLPLVLVGARTNTANSEAVVYIFALTNPPAGSNNVVVKWDKAQTDGDVMGCATFTGVDQTNPYGPFFSNTGTSTSVSLVVNSAPGELVFDTVMVRSANFGAGSPGPNQATVWRAFFNTKVGAGASTQAGAATVTNTWSAASAVDWAIGGISIKPAVVSNSTNTTTFVQTNVFCSSFTMLSNNLVTITNFITVTNGAMPPNPNITATLRYNGFNFLTLTNPTYSSASSNLVWSGILSTNVTVPGGQAISYVITNREPGTAFHVNYDGTNAQSKITLPTSTVITVNTLGVYDAPYPGGNLVLSPTAGSTLYARATVSDPFGSYDVTGLGLAITAPSGGANVNTNLNAANIVADDGCTRTFEYRWVTGTTLGNYNLVATGQEGTEGVTASAVASVTLIFLDVGTPSTTEFTSGNNGPATNAYPGSAAGTVCVRVTDLNRNTNTATAQTIMATVSCSPTGDIETLTLTETGTNTGIFSACLNTSTNFANVPGDNTLFAPVGSVLTASYSDPTDASDNSSATATILPPAGTPGIKMTKTRIAPIGGQATLGTTVTFNLQVVNTGSTVLTNVAVMDSFPSNKLTYASASPLPTTVGVSSLTWSNIGTLTPGQSTNLTVNFTAAASGMATNSATANGGTATNSSSATVQVTRAGVNVVKTVLSPTNSPVAIGSNVVFRVTVQNTGDTVIPTLPMEDNFSGAYFQFISATIPPNGTGAGSLLWTNLASTAALATNAIITNDITMKVVGQGNPANNTAVVDYAVDTFGNAVPTATGSTNVTTAAATVAGFVYNDRDISGSLTVTDAPLASVTVSLYTDPSGTGTPVALTQITTTSAGGYYEFNNIALGRYVVVATPPAGFLNNVPANGRIPLNLTTLTVTNNNNFFQYQPNPLLTSTFTGTVFNDLLGTGVSTNQGGLAFVTVDLVQDVNSNGVADTGEPLLNSATTATNGTYTFAGVPPGRYVIRESDLFGYYSSGDAQSPNDNQIAIVTTNGIITTTNYFFDRLLPTAVNDTNGGLYLVALNINPLTNDISPNGDALTISNATTTDGILVINAGRTNLTFTPTNFGTATIQYTMADAHGGMSNAVIYVTVTALADVAAGKSAPATVLAASNLTYTISVTNLGPSGASSVTVTDAVPPGASFVSATGGGVNNSGVVTWTLGSLGSGAVSNVTLTVLAPASGSLTNVAAGGSPTSDPTPTNNTTPPVITTVIPQADVRIGKTGAATVLAASNLVYSISVTNIGPSTASSVTVTDAVPTGATFVSASGAGVTNAGVVTWNVGNLASGATTNLTLTVLAPVSGSLTNVASAGSPTGDPVLTNNITPPVVTTVVPLADLAINKTGPATVFAASNLSYTISVTNFGPSGASSVVVTDTLPAGVIFVSASGGGANSGGLVSWALGTLASGQTSNLTLTVTAPASGTLTNVANVASPTGDTNILNNTSAQVITTVTPVADVVIGKFGPSTVLATSNLIYSLSVTNFGPSSANSVTVTDAIPTGATFVSASGTGVTNAGVVTWNVGNLASGATTNLTLTVLAPTSGSITNVASAGSPTGDPVLTNNITPPVVTTVIPLSDLMIAKTGPATVFAGSNLTYTISVTNLGPSTASSVTVTDSVPSGASFVSTTGGGINNSGLVTWNLGILSGGAMASVTLTVTAPASGTLTNIATVGTPTGDPILTNNITPPVITTVLSLADVSVVKSGPAGALFGTNFTYTLTVSNAGPSTASGVIVTDTLPAGLVFVSSVPATTTNGISQVIWSLGSLNAGVNSNLALTVLSTLRGSMTNLASGGSPTPDPVPTNNPAPPVVTTVTNYPPVANPDSFAITENTTNTFPPLVNDIVRTPGGSLTILAVSPTNGTATILGGTNVVFTPANNFLGTAFIGYTITDNVGGTNNSTVTVLVTNVPPIANPDTYTVAENSTNTLTPLVNDILRTPGGVLQIVGLTPTNGTATILNLTNVLFTPSSNFVGVATIGYTITDNVGGTNSSVITVTVSNLPPTAFSQSLATPENTALPITLTGSDPTGLPLTFVIVSGPAGGTLTGLNTNTGAVIYTPTNNFTGTDTFTFLVNNGYNNSTNATVSIAVTPHADLLVAQSGPPSGVAGVNLTYTVAVTNLGPASATNVIVTNQLDAGFIFVSASSGGSTNGIRQVLWNVPVLTAGGATNFTVTVVAIEGGTFTNIASGISVTPDLNATNNNGSLTNARVVTAISALADVAVLKTGTLTVLAGGTVNYAITVTNLGPSTASNVVARDALPAGVIFQTASGNNSMSSNVITWAGLTLAAGGVTNFTVSVTAPTAGTLTNIASSTSDTADPNTGNNDGSSPSSVVITPVTPVADLNIGKSAAASVLATSNLVYTISVTNLGPSTASSVTVTDAVPAGAIFVTASGGGTNNLGVVTWNLGNLGGGVVSNLTLTVAAPASGTLTNVATGGSPTGDPTPTNSTPPVITTVIPQADIQLGKSGPATVLATSNVLYTISVTNFGPSTASSVTMTDAVPVGASFVSASGSGVNNAGIVTWTLGNLASGAVSNVTLTVAAPTSGSLTNVATGGSPTGDPTPTNSTPPVITTIIPQADIQLGKTGPATVLATSNVFYTISVTNFGPSVASSVTVTDAVPVGASFVSASGSGVNNVGIVTWTLGDLASGAVSNVTLIVAAPASGTLTNVATGGSPTGDPTPTNSTPPVITTIIPQADIQLGKTGPATVLATSNVLYTISVTNFGPSTASSVTVTDAVPAGATFVTASGGGVNNAGLVTWTLGNLASGVVSNVTLTVAAPASGSLTNVATGGSPTGDPTPTNSTPPVITAIIPQADIQLGKTGPATALATSNVLYTISVTNFGPSTASSVTVTDAVPVGATFVGTTGGGVNNAGIVTWNLGNLTSGAVSNVTLTVAAPASGSLTNVATGGSPTGDPTPTNSTPPVITAIIPQADVQIGKTAASTVLATSNLVYTISVTNVGPSTATSVTVTDAVPAGASFVSTTGGGVNNSGLVTWSLGNLASGATTTVTLTVTAPTSGTLTNVATAGTPTGDPVPTNNITPPVITTIIPQADVAIVKNGPAGATFNTNFSYTISVTNFGPSTASGILVTDTLPAGLVFSSAVPATATNSIGQVVWSIGNLDSNTGTNLTLTVVSTARGGVTNIASVGAPTLDPTLTNNISQPVITSVTNVPPVANPDAYAIAENSVGNVFTPLVNDLVLNPGGVLQLLSVTTTNGIAVTNGNNVVYAPATNFTGTVTLLYTITDNVGGTNSSLITVLVTNIPPIANPDSYTVGENSGTTTLSPLVNDVARTPGGVLSLVSVSPTNGTASISGTNVLFAPALNFFGIATIGYTISDGIGGASTSLITVNVTNVPPVANPQSVSTPENVPLQITLTGSDPNLLPLTFAIVTNPPNGALSGLNPATGVVTYTPNTNYTGSDSFSFRVNNGQTNSAPALVSITIIPVADLVVVQSGPATGFAGSNLVFTVSVTNRGPAAATSLVVSNRLAAGFTFVNASGGGVNNGGIITWNFASLPANGVTNFTVTAFATEGGAYTNIASGVSAVLDLNVTNNNGSLANAQSVTVLAPVVDLVVYKDGGTNVFAGALVNYTITASNAGPSTASSATIRDILPVGASFQTTSDTYTLSNNVVTWDGLTLTPGQVMTFNLTLLASPSVTSFLNIASGTNTAFDPILTNNDGSFPKSRVTTKVTPSADVIAAISGPTNAFVGSNIVFTLLLTNAGPSTASNVVASDILPPSLIFVSASNGGTNSNGTNGGGTITWPPIPALLAGGSTNFTFTARSFVVGRFTNIVFATSVTFDPNPTNNTGVLPNAQAVTALALPQFTWAQGAPVFNPQTGLYEEQVTVTNNGPGTVAGIQVYVGGLRSGVSLYNANGTNGGVPFVQYGFPLDPSNTVHFVLEFYNPSRLPFTNTISVAAYTPTNTTVVGPTNSIPVNKVFLDSRQSPPRIVIEWASVIGRTYLVIYADTPNATNWFVGTPSITATANVTQWYDDGPPKTSSPPLSTTTRFYRVIQY